MARERAKQSPASTKASPKAKRKATKKATKKVGTRSPTQIGAKRTKAPSRSVRTMTKAVPTAAEIGADLVALCNRGRGDDVVAKWYHPRLVSVEGDGTKTVGLKQLAAKYAWWYANHEVHSQQAIGPFVGATGFAVRFDIAMTPKGGRRMELSEIAVYTVRDGAIVREEFMYRA